MFASSLVAVASVGALGVGTAVADEIPEIETIVPIRLLDTRSNGDTIDGAQEGIGRRGAGSVTEVQVTGRPGVPSDATAAVLNLTGIQASTRGFLTAYPCGADRPTASNLNYERGANVANGAIIEIGTGGRVCVFNSEAVDLAVDLTGYAPAEADLDTLVPFRLLDTRSGGSRLAAGTETPVQVTGRAGIPGDAAAAILNITGIQGSSLGFLTAYPCGAARPVASNLNYDRGINIANSAIIEIGSGGRVCIFNSAPVNIAVDVTGYTPNEADLDTIVPARLLDTRGAGATIDGLQQGDGRVPAGETTEVQVRGRPGVPSDAVAAILNITGIQGSSRGFLTAYPCGADQPLTSNLNYEARTNIANGAIIRIGDAGKVCIFNSAPLEMAVDITGYTVAVTDGAGVGTTTTLAPETAPLAFREFANAGARIWCTLGDPDPQCDRAVGGGEVERDVYPTLRSATNIAAGASFGCARLGDGTVRCFGNNGSGQLGDGTTTSSSTPVPVAGISNARDVDAGLTEFACSALRTGQVRCWGENGSGQLGDGTTTDSTTPVTVRGIDDAIAVSAGGTFACALRGDRTVTCWGSGLLGDGRTSIARTGVDVLGLSDVTMLSVGERHACVAIADNSVACWGRNGRGQIGNGTREDAPITDIATGLDDFIAVSAGDAHSCGRRVNDEVACWGNNSSGQIDFDPGPDVLSPQTIDDLDDTEAIATGQLFTVALSGRPANSAGTLVAADATAVRGSLG